MVDASDIIYYHISGASSFMAFAVLIQICHCILHDAWYCCIEPQPGDDPELLVSFFSYQHLIEYMTSTLMQL
jgi:hypothetical protein